MVNAKHQFAEDRIRERLQSGVKVSPHEFLHEFHWQVFLFNFTNSIFHYDIEGFIKGFLTHAPSVITLLLSDCGNHVLVNFNLMLEAAI